MDEKSRLMTYYGYAFESFCCRSGRDDQFVPGWGGDVDTNVQWCSVVKTKLNDLRIIIGGEVDCIRGNKYLDRKVVYDLSREIHCRTRFLCRTENEHRSFPGAAR